MKLQAITLILFSLLLAGCESEAEKLARERKEMVWVPMEAWNLTRYEMRTYIANGHLGYATSEGGSIVIPKAWDPEFKVKIKWRRLDTSKLGESPYSNDTKGWEVFEQKMKENTSYHEAIVDIPEYDYKKDFCSFKVYFLECDVIKIRVNCKSPGLPYDEYPKCDNPS
ncbi:DUF3304 domain-containing protein, partial [Pseudomonas sp. F1_0610]|uniref:DUF3304 domain-containing protein n=1 Tax=Pseudomonas sp. F1_0610 TaxID=3114284 RepID=UPI0039C1D6AF